jgi:hypothetical protein
MDESQLEQELKNLAVQAELVFAQNKIITAKNIAQFESRVLDTITLGAKDRIEAIKWIAQAESHEDDLGFLCYTLGLPYSYFKD